MSNVIHLPPPAKPEPNADLVAQLEALLDVARQGSVQAFAYVALGDPEGPPAVGWSGKHRNALMAGAIGLMETLRWKPVP